MGEPVRVALESVLTSHGDLKSEVALELGVAMERLAHLS